MQRVFFFLFFTLYFLRLYFERAFVNLYILSFMKAHRLQRNFSEGKRPKRANSLTNVNARIFYLQGNWFEIHSKYYLYLSHREESSVICTQVNANFGDSTRSFRGKLTRAAF